MDRNRNSQDPGKDQRSPSRNSATQRPRGERELYSTGEVHWYSQNSRDLVIIWTSHQTIWILSYSPALQYFSGFKTEANAKTKFNLQWNSESICQEIDLYYDRHLHFIYISEIKVWAAHTSPGDCLHVVLGAQNPIPFWYKKESWSFYFYKTLTSSSKTSSLYNFQG